VPLAAVMFVAESTGRPEFVVPGLIAAVVAQLVMGNSSVTEYQQSERGGHLQRRFALPLTSVLETDVRTVPPDATIAEFHSLHLVGARQKTVAVVDGAKYLGMARLDDLIDVPREVSESTPVRDIMRTDRPVGLPHWTIRQAAKVMEAADTDVLPVVGLDGGLIGVTTTADVFKLDEILEQTEDDT
jgi:Mg/Co/Ni transporter MgtE